MHEFLHNGRGPVYSVRPTTLSENDHNSEAARFDDNSPTGKERPLDFFGQSAPISLGYAFCEGQGDVEGCWDASRRESRPETGPQGRPGALLPLRSREGSI